MSFGQAVKLANAAKARAAKQNPTLPKWALGAAAKQALQPGPLADASSQLNPVQLATAKRVGVHQTAAMGVVNQVIHPAVDLLQGAAGERHISLPGAVSDVANIAGNVLSPEKVGLGAGIIGLRGLKGAKEVAPLAEDAAKIAPHMTPEAGQIRDVIPGAKIARGKVDAGYSPQRGARSNTADAIYKDSSLSVPDRIAKADAVLKGPLDKPKYTGMSHFTPEEVQGFQKQAMEHPTLPFYQRLRVVKSLDAAANGVPPTKSDLKIYEKVWGKNQASQIFGKAHSGVWNGFLSVANIPRSIMSTLDQSFGLRQGLVAAFYDPKNWWKNYSQSFSYLSKHLGTGEEGLNRLMDNIHADPDFHVLHDQAGLALTDLEHEAGMREEAVPSALAEQMVIKGHGPGNAIRGAGRGYTGAGVGMRFDIGKRLLSVMREKGIANEQNIKDMGSFVNAITGRGNLPGKVLQESAPLINALFFSPRLAGSRVQMLTEPFNIALMRRNPYIWRQYVKANAKTFGTLGLILATVRQFVHGAKVNMNPRSSDFGKIKVGDTRIDLLGGFNQFFHQAGMQYTGQTISSTTGKMTSLTSGKFGQPTRWDEFQNFLIGKESPSPGIVTDFLRNKNPNHFGKKFNVVDEAKTKLAPLALQDAYGAFSDPGKMNKYLEGLLAYAGSGSGIGIQTYGKTSPKAKKGKGGGYVSPYAPGGGGSYVSPYSPGCARVAVLWPAIRW
jgi:hypothetical protein